MKLRRILSVTLILVLIMSCFSFSASAVSAKYSTTRAFLSAMDDEGYKYTYVGIDNDDDEQVTISFRGENKDTIKANVFFNKDLDSVSMRVWNLIDFKESDYTKVLKVIDELHNQYKYVTFYVDQNDWSVTAKLNSHIRPGNAWGETVLEDLLSLINVSDEGYDLLRVYAIK